MPPAQQYRAIRRRHDYRVVATFCPPRTGNWINERFYPPRYKKFEQRTMQWGLSKKAAFDAANTLNRMHGLPLQEVVKRPV